MARTQTIQPHLIRKRVVPLPSVSATLSRTSGVAPLAVFFDATETGGVLHPFTTLDLTYEWDFDDEASGTWATTGKSKNVAYEPVAAHVYETPGTYHPTLTVTNKDGVSVVASYTVTVSDPDVVYAGTLTICVSQAGDFTGKPTGASEVTTSNFATAMGSIAEGKRVLFRAGETWDASAGPYALDMDGPITVGSFGTGDPPEFQGEFVKLSTGDTHLSDARFMDLTLTGSQNEQAFQSEGQYTDTLFLRIDATGYDRFINAGWKNVSYWVGAGYPQDIHTGVFIVESSETAMHEHGMYADGRMFAVMGCTFNGSIGSHCFRTEMAQKLYWAHNDSKSAGPNLHLLKLGAPYFSSPGAFAGQYSEFCAVVDNIFHDADQVWPVSIQPENSIEDERVRRVVVARNTFKSGGNGGEYQYLNISAVDVVVRDNVAIMTGSDAQKCYMVHVNRRGIEPPPHHVVVVHNSCYRSDEGQTIGCFISKDATECVVANNVVRGVEDPGYFGLAVEIEDGADVIATNNLYAKADVTGMWSVTNPATAAQFALGASSPAKNAGSETYWPHQDYDGIQSDYGGTAPDLGAFES